MQNEEYQTILVEKSSESITITMNRPEYQNSINETLLREINDALDLVEQDPACRVAVLRGQPGCFCTGMDFNEVSRAETRNPGNPPNPGEGPGLFMETIKRFSLIPAVIISVIDGRVMAGGVGLAAASDLAIATPRSQFSLSEALWGLLPAMVMPYLIRRVGFQPAYRMTLTTMPVPAQEACEAHLVDEISETPDESLRRWFLRLSKLEKSTLKNIKQYFREMWLITEQMEAAAVSETTRLTADPKVVENIVNYVKYQKLPWEPR